MFCIDERIQSSCFTLGDWPLSRVLLKNEVQFPWLILVPRKDNIQEIHQLDKDERIQLMEEINQLSRLMTDYFKPDKLNVGALGNIVSQLHVHVVARSTTDCLWPQGIWQPALKTIPYDEEQLSVFIPKLSGLISNAGAVWR
ncbi:HIT domain-containing protein [Legionella shakespearei]|uniref:Diadenosine tetraphosphate (Ap4A) hydrolase-like HIT family hydrolase n=1 Tax=Legionella shakespearei DSM 23087 TaxID=1122169 RepID=A0A0W0Z9T4_9GAMM|nr:HIT domain-containing protein [Legionella shakespearei]KTD65863.1 diadenosine tetraphosphate (Ap4A) hydrolase-like HIT family hydrolase [Legionella shakespearei DSM 23087]